MQLSATYRMVRLSETKPKDTLHWLASGEWDTLPVLKIISEKKCGWAPFGSQRPSSKVMLSPKKHPSSWTSLWQLRWPRGVTEPLMWDGWVSISQWQPQNYTCGAEGGYAVSLKPWKACASSGGWHHSPILPQPLLYHHGISGHWFVLSVHMRKKKGEKMENKGKKERRLTF